MTIYINQNVVIYYVKDLKSQFLLDNISVGQDEQGKYTFKINKVFSTSAIQILYKQKRFILIKNKKVDNNDQTNILLQLLLESILGVKVNTIQAFIEYPSQFLQFQYKNLITLKFPNNYHYISKLLLNKRLVNQQRILFAQFDTESKYTEIDLIPDVLDPQVLQAQVIDFEDIELNKYNLIIEQNYHKIKNPGFCNCSIDFDILDLEIDTRENLIEQRIKDQEQ